MLEDATVLRKYTLILRKGNSSRYILQRVRGWTDRQREKGREETQEGNWGRREKETEREKKRDKM